MHTYEEVLKGFQAIPLTESKVIIVHNSYKSLGGVEGGADTVIDALQAYVGEDGTVLYPNFNFQSWTESHYFDVRETPSRMGIIGELARRRPGATRTPHPIYSFAAIGPRADEFAACDDPEAYGPNSVFARFHELNGVMISIGLGWNDTFSFVHYVEYHNQVEHRRVKPFSGIYVGRDGKPQLKTYTMYVRKTFNVITDVVRATDKLYEDGIIKGVTVGDAAVHYVAAKDYFDNLSVIAREHPEWLHRYEKPKF